jgi:hypothetical protein
MSQFYCVLITCSLLCGPLAISASAARLADEQPSPSAPAGEASTPAEKAEPGEKPQAPRAEQAKKELSPAQIALRDRVRRTLAALRQQSFSTRENTVADVLHLCLAFGCDAEVVDAIQPGQKVNGITCLCWNLPCGGYTPLMLYEGHLAPRTGFGYQELPSQLAATLALARVPAEYPARAGESVRKVADLIEHEKRSCRKGTDLSLKLIALSYYVQEPTWKNSLGEEWSVERMVEEELARSAASAPCGGLLRVMGLTCALERKARRSEPIEGDMLRAKKYVEDSQDYALRSQNSDGSWGRGRDLAAMLSASGHVLEWLAMSLPADRLEDPQMVRGIEYVDSALSSQRYRWSVQSLSSQEIAAVMHATHALVVYDDRVFQPADAPSPAPAAKVEKVAKQPAR